MAAVHVPSAPAARAVAARQRTSSIESATLGLICEPPRLIYHRQSSRSKREELRPLPGARFRGSMNPMKRVAARADHELTVATRNVKDFGGCNVPIFNPW